MRRYLCLALPALLAPAGLAAAAGARDVQDVVYLDDSRPILVRMHVRVDGKPYLEAWEQFIGRVFKYLDADGDGVLSKEEAARAPHPSVLFNGGFFGGFNPRAAAMDANNDGKVTRAELASYYRRNGAAPFQFSGGNDQPNLGYRVIYAGGGMGGPPPADELNRTLFKLLDTNKDGKLSRKELAAAPEVLGKLDADDDEMVSASEFTPNRGGGDQFGVVRFVAVPGSNPPARSGGPFVLVSPGESNAALARQMLARYGGKGKRPARTLTREQIGLDREAFARLDADEDGELDAEELARFARRAPDLEIVVRVGKRKADEPMVEVVPGKGGSSALAGKVRKGAGGNPALDLGVTRIDFGGGGTGMPGPTKFVLNVRQQYRAQFKAADRDNNGYLDQNEARQSPFFQASFRYLDTNGDGKLFEKEMLAALDKMKKLQEAARVGCVSMFASDQGRGLFDLIDTDRDRRLSVRELRQVAKLVAPLDRDGDGQVSEREIPRNYRVTFRQGPLSVGGGFGRQVAVFSYGMAPPQPLPRQTRGPAWFRKMDRNRDGDVSRREFLGTAEDFRKIDADGDGLISAEEAEKPDKVLGKGGARKP